jgi:histidyl-tRNA synthetase
VRGLDYYSHCVFEYRTSALGAQDAILSGGRYDGLIQQMGGPATPGFGWAAGIERLAMLSPLEPVRARPIAVIPVHSTAEAQSFELCYKLRAAGFNCEIAFSGNLSKRMKRASGQNAWAAVVVGPDELARGEVMLKLLDTSEQKTIRLADLEATLKSSQPENV